MIVTFLTFADTLDNIKKEFPDVLYCQQDNENISVTIELKDNLDVWKLFSAGMNYGADRMMAARISDK